jgi:methanogenic corrinoid protein MtbC1
MQQALGQGLSTAEAAQAALEEIPADSGGEALDLADGRRLLVGALTRFDDASAHSVLDRLFATQVVEEVLSTVVVPCLRDIGDQWASGNIDVSQEHFASNLLRRRVSTLLKEGAPGTRTAVLACPPGELHDLPLLVHAVCLSRRGWQVIFLGADVPVDDLQAAVVRLQPTVLVLAATRPSVLGAITEPLRGMSASVPLAIAGAGAESHLALEVGALHLTDDPVSAATRLDRFHHPAPTEA